MHRSEEPSKASLSPLPFLLAWAVYDANMPPRPLLPPAKEEEKREESEGKASPLSLQPNCEPKRRSRREGMN